MSERTLRVRHEGLMLYRSWAETMLRAEQRHEDVPEPGNVDEMVEWLDDGGHLDHPSDESLPVVDVEQARVLIELVQAGGEHVFESD